MKKLTLLLLAVAIALPLTAATLAGPVEPAWTLVDMPDDDNGGSLPGVKRGSPCDPVADANKVVQCWYKMANGEICVTSCKCRFVYIPGVGVIAWWEPTTYGGNG